MVASKGKGVKAKSAVAGSARYDVLNCAKGTRKVAEQLAEMMSAELGVPVSVPTATEKALAEAVERRRK